MNYDIIGDIHGHADALKALLASMGYRETADSWRHSQRQAIFVGDFIDRGPEQVETVTVVRRMVDAGSAQAIMGNHEFNAIAWFTPDPANPGEFLRRHNSPKHGQKNREQHKAFLAEVEGTPRHREIINWFHALPLWLDLPELRVVHACWHPHFMDYLQPQLAEGNRLNAELMIAASREPDNEAEKDTTEPSVFKAVEALTKGIEIPLPGERSFQDQDGHTRRRVRVRWWDPDATTYPAASMLADGLREQLPDEPIPAHARIADRRGKPVFFGHYWLSGAPAPQNRHAACVDYSVAKGGKLVAYRWGGEPSLAESNFHWVGK